MSEPGTESFGLLLREKMAELDADEASQLALVSDPVERLRLDARQVVLAEQLGPMPRSGHQVYVTPAAPAAAEPGQRHLNILY